jgi:hypothetical protein
MRTTPPCTTQAETQRSRWPEPQHRATRHRRISQQPIDRFRIRTGTLIRRRWPSCHRHRHPICPAVWGRARGMVGCCSIACEPGQQGRQKLHKWPASNKAWKRQKPARTEPEPAQACALRHRRGRTRAHVAGTCAGVTPRCAKPHQSIGVQVLNQRWQQFHSDVIAGSEL